MLLLLRLLLRLLRLLSLRLFLRRARLLLLAGCVYWWLLL